MKRVFSVLVVCVMICAMFAGCGSTQQDPTTTGTPAGTTTVPTTTPSTTAAPTQPAVQLPASALEMLTNIVDAWDFEYKAYFMGGGYATGMVEGAPGAVDATDTDTLQYLMYVPEACLTDIQDAASYCHSMNYSVFTSGAFKVTDAAAFAANLKSGLDGAQWMCGIPEYLMIYTLGNEYVLFVMGTSDNLAAFSPALKTAYPDAVAYFDGLMG